MPERPIVNLVASEAIRQAARLLVLNGHVVVGQNPLLGDLTAIMEAANLTDDQVIVSFQTEPRGVVLTDARV